MYLLLNVGPDAEEEHCSLKTNIKKKNFDCNWEKRGFSLCSLCRFISLSTFVYYFIHLCDTQIKLLLSSVLCVCWFTVPLSPVVDAERKRDRNRSFKCFNSVLIDSRHRFRVWCKG